MTHSARVASSKITHNEYRIIPSGIWLKSKCLDLLIEDIFIVNFVTKNTLSKFMIFDPKNSLKTNGLASLDSS